MVGRNVSDLFMQRGIQFVAPTSSELNLLRVAETERYIGQLRPTLIVHAAGKVGGIQANIANQSAFLIENLAMGSNVVQAARAARVERLVNLGSSCMYPRDHDDPLDESEVLSGELEPTNEGYAIAKCAVARLCQYVNREDDQLRYKTLIPSNIFGRYDHFEPSRSHLVPAIIRKLHEAKQTGSSEVEIWGDGLARREFLYAGELAAAVYRAVVEFDTLPELTNIGLGSDYTVNEYYEVAARVIGYRGRFVHNLERPVGMRRKLLNVARARDWGWSSRTSLEDGLVATYRYYLGEIDAVPAR
jgi:GDP-L-fucose synthase